MGHGEAGPSLTLARLRHIKRACAQSMSRIPKHRQGWWAYVIHNDCGERHQGQLQLNNLKLQKKSTCQPFQTRLSHRVSWQSHPNRASQGNSTNLGLSHFPLISMALFTPPRTGKPAGPRGQGRGPNNPLQLGAGDGLGALCPQTERY